MGTATLGTDFEAILQKIIAQVTPAYQFSEDAGVMPLDVYDGKPLSLPAEVSKGFLLLCCSAYSRVRNAARFNLDS